MPECTETHWIQGSRSGAGASASVVNACETLPHPLEVGQLARVDELLHQHRRELVELRHDHSHRHGSIKEASASTLRRKAMRILFFTQYFMPEVTARRVQAQAFAEGLAARGTRSRSSARCRTTRGDRARGLPRPGAGRRGRLDGYRVDYVWVRARPEKNFVNRVLFYGTYAARRPPRWARSRRPDVVLASSPPLPAAPRPPAVAARRPGALGARRPRPVAGGGGDPRRAAATRARSGPPSASSARLYQAAAAITTVTEPFRARDRRRGSPETKIE